MVYSCVLFLWLSLSLWQGATYSAASVQRFVSHLKGISECVPIWECLKFFILSFKIWRRKIVLFVCIYHSGVRSVALSIFFLRAEWAGSVLSGYPGLSVAATFWSQTVSAVADRPHHLSHLSYMMYQYSLLLILWADLTAALMLKPHAFLGAELSTRQRVLIFKLTPLRPNLETLSLLIGQKPLPWIHSPKDNRT